MSEKNTLLFHDTFITRSGAERMNINMATILDTDIATAIWSTHCYNPEELGYHGRIFEVFHNFHK